MNLLYLGLNILWIAIPTLLLIAKKHLRGIKWKFYIAANLLITAFFSLWVIGFTAMGTWEFNDAMLSGIYISNIPVEEVISFLCLPFLFVFIYEALPLVIKANPLGKFHRWIALLFAVLLILFTVKAWGKLYSTVPSILLTLFLLQHLLYNYRWMGRFLLAFLAFAPLLIIHRNMILANDIIIMNMEEIWGIHIFAMPLADLVFYFLMVFMNTWIYENFQRISERRRRLKTRKKEAAAGPGNSEG